MIKLLYKALVFSISVVVILFLYISFVDKIAEHMWGINTSHQISKSFKMAKSREYNCLFLGNSSIYRDVNPDMIENSKTFNFANDNDAFNQCFYKLKYIYESGKQIDTLILGADYTSFAYISDTRNYIYNRYFDHDYAADYYDNKAEQLISDFQTYYQTKQSLSYLLFKPFVLFQKFDVPYLKDNGQYIKKGKASPDDTVVREELFLEYQNDYLKRIVDFCEQQNIELIILVCPTRDEELLSMSEEYRLLVESKLKSALKDRADRNYYNFSADPSFKDFNDYVDICHLNPNAADRFTVHMWECIKGRN